MATDIQDMQRIRKIAVERSGDHAALISVLQDVQAAFNYVPPASLEIVAEELDVPLSKVYGVATFFKAFSMKPRGRHVVTTCLGTACHVRASARVLLAIETKLGVEAGETTADGRFTVEKVNCLGCCAVGPVVVVDGDYHGEMTVKNVDAVLKGYR